MKDNLFELYGIEAEFVGPDHQVNIYFMAGKAVLEEVSAKGCVMFVCPRRRQNIDNLIFDAQNRAEKNGKKILKFYFPEDRRDIVQDFFVGCHWTTNSFGGVSLIKDGKEIAIQG